VTSALPEFVLHWARALGSNETSVMPLKGGMNSRVFSCVVGDKRFVIKGYQPLEAGQRDRFAAEKQFLLYANAVATGYVPQVLHIDDHRRCIVMEYLEGDAYVEGSSPPSQDIDAAVRFFSLLNEDPVRAAAQITMDAAEGFLKISAHLENVRERLRQMSVEHLPLNAQPKAKKAIRLLQERFGQVEEGMKNALSAGQVEDDLPADKRCISPSDFGFHNAIRTHKGVKFFDFEFGGWDDPAKAVVDFMLQPKVPIRQHHFALLNEIDNEEQKATLRRAETLKPILQLKWLCIIAGFLRKPRFMRLLTTLPNNQLEQLFLYKLDQMIRATKEEAVLGIH
jgi:hypothetical protein